jgi:hypothetical protein
VFDRMFTIEGRAQVWRLLNIEYDRWLLCTSPARRKPIAIFWPRPAVRGRLPSSMFLLPPRGSCDHTLSALWLTRGLPFRSAVPDRPA